MLSKLPQSKTENIVVQNLESELLIYDLVTNKAFCLNETSAIVYQACNGQTTFDELKQKYQYPDELIFLTIDELNKADLLETDADNIEPFSRIKRREIIKKIGLTSMIALPVISSLVAPNAIQAAASCIGVGGTCISDNFQQSNCCTSLRCNPAFDICTPCVPQGADFVNCSSPGNCACDSVFKNVCCNASAPTTNNGINCFCG